MSSQVSRRDHHQLQQPVIILGAGIIGCAIAYSILKEGFHVILVADKLPGCKSAFYPSQWAGASWHFSKEGSNEDKYLQAVTFRIWSRMRDQDGPKCGVMPVLATEFYETAPTDRPSYWAERVTTIQTFTNADRSMPPPYQSTIEYDSLVVDPNFHLPYLKQKIEQMGGHFLEKKVSALSDLYAMFPDSRVIINASGCGSKDLSEVRDEKCYWERGQNVFLKTDKTQEVLIGHAAAPKMYTYVIPRPLQGGVILGGVKQPENFSIEIDMAVAQDEIQRTHQLAPHIVPANPHKEDLSFIVGMRPCRKGGFRLDSMQVDAHRLVISAYGFGGNGYAFSFGIAENVVCMVKQAEFRHLFEDKVAGFAIARL